MGEARKLKSLPAKTLIFLFTQGKKRTCCHSWRNKLGVLSASNYVSDEEQQTIPLTSRGNLAFLSKWGKRGWEKKAGGYLYTSNIH